MKQSIQNMSTTVILHRINDSQWNTMKHMPSITSSSSYMLYEDVELVPDHTVFVSSAVFVLHITLSVYIYIQYALYCSCNMQYVCVYFSCVFSTTLKSHHRLHDNIFVISILIYFKDVKWEVICCDIALQFVRSFIMTKYHSLYFSSLL